MASHVVVIDSSFRRAQVKVTPGTYMTDVVEQACKKLGLKGTNYGLKINSTSKPVDVSRTFRQTGLTSGAKLDLIVVSRSPSVVSVALQLPEAVASEVPGGRLTDKFASDETLWLILRKFETTGGTGKNLNFTARAVTEIENGSSGAGRIFYEMPVLNIMGRELATFGDLQKNLAQLGFNGGSTLIRLGFRKTDMPLEEAMKEIGTYFKEVEAEEPLETGDTLSDALARLPSDGPEAGGFKDTEMSIDESETTSTTDPSPYPETVGDLPPPLTPSKRSAPDNQEEVVLGPDQRPISVYSAPSGDTPKAALIPHNESDFEPTIAHAKLHQSRLLNNTINKRLLSDAEEERLAAEKAAKLASTKQVKIRVRFPDQTSIESNFTAVDTGASLYSFVTGVIQAEGEPFKLIYTDKGSQTVPRDEQKLIKNLGFAGAVLVVFHWEDAATDKVWKQPVLKSQYAQKAKEVSVPKPPVEDTKEDDEVPAKEEKKGGSTGGGGQKGKGKMPAWLLKGLHKK